MRRILAYALSWCVLAVALTGCGTYAEEQFGEDSSRQVGAESLQESVLSGEDGENDESEFQTLGLSGGTFDYSTVPEYSGESSYIVHNDVPFFTDDELTTVSYLDFGELDELGRCTTAQACLGTDTLAPEDQERGSIGMIKPSGWVMKKYDCVEGNYCVNRAHLVGYALSNKLADERNLITGTRYLNLEMLYGTELEVLYYIQDTENHVLYRVTPVFVGEELMCRGILMEGMSVEDNGAGILFCRYYYNVQPGLEFDYTTGDSYYTGIFLDTDSPAVNMEAVDVTEEANVQTDEENASESGDATDAYVTYVCNMNTMKFHSLDCVNVAKISEKNRLDTTESRDELISEGYEPAGCCNP